MMLQEVDIAIIGGGMVGASLAALLPAHFNIMVVESFSLPEQGDEAPV
jgi:glycine/D-amino acid oxidase-like deaminating enzyme